MDNDVLEITLRAEIWTDDSEFCSQFFEQPLCPNMDATIV